MDKNCRQDEVQEGQEEKGEEDGAGAGDEDHVHPGEGGWQQQGELHSQPAGLWKGALADSNMIHWAGDGRAWNVAHSLSLVLAQHLQEDSDLENYLTSVEEDMMEFKLSYEMWRVGRWAVSIPHVSYKYRWQCGMSRRLVICQKRLCEHLSSDAMVMLEPECEWAFTAL